MSEQSWWMRRCARGVAATAEALFPENDQGVPDWREAEVVDRTMAYLFALPPANRRLIVVMYLAIDLLPWLTFTDLRWFSWAPPARREALVRRWRASWMWPVRMLGDALKAQATMMYLSHPSVMGHVGVFKSTANPDDPFHTEVQPEVVREHRTPGDAA